MMDELIERLEQDLGPGADTSALRRPADARRRARHRRWVLEYSASSWPPPSSRDGRRPARVIATVPATTRGADANRSALPSRRRQAWVVDPPGTPRGTSVPELAPGDAPYRVVRRETLVAWRTERSSCDPLPTPSPRSPRERFAVRHPLSPDRVGRHRQGTGRCSSDRGPRGVDRRPGDRAGHTSPNGAWPVAAVDGSVFQRRADVRGTHRPAGNRRPGPAAGRAGVPPGMV